MGKSENRRLNKAGTAPGSGVVDSPAFPMHVLDSLTTHLAVIDSSGLITYVNQAWKDYTRNNDGDFTMVGPGVNYLNICERACYFDPTPETSGALAGLKKIIAGELQHFELEYPCHSPGQERWFLMRCSPLTNVSGHILIAHIDISTQKSLEGFYQESRQEYLRVVNTIQDGVAIANKSGDILFVNRAFTEIYQYQRKDALGMNTKNLFHPEYLGMFERFSDHLLDNDSFIGQAVNMRRDGTNFFADLRGAKISFHGEECFLVVVRDISKRKKAQKALKDSEQLYFALFEKNTSMILLINPEDGRIVNANPAACGFYGYSRHQFTKKKVHDLNELAPEKVSQMLTFVRTGESNHFHFQHRLAGGEVRDVEVFAGPIRVGGNLLICSIVHDISARRRVEQEKELLIEELQSALKEIKTLRGILPICAHCKKIRDDRGYWNQIESYINQHSEASFSHGICPSCIEKLYPDIAPEILKKLDKDK